MVPLSTASESESILSVQNVDVSFGPLVVLEGVNFDMTARDFTAIIGPNGGGKSTLIQAILGLIPIQNGQIQLFGSHPAQGRRHVGYLAQSRTIDSHYPITVSEVVLMASLGNRWIRFYTSADYEKSRSLSGSFGYCPP